MTSEELNFIKGILKRKDDATKELWLEKQLLRNLILDSGWMSEQDLDSAVADGKILPENIRQVEENFSLSDQQLAEIGLADWLAELEKKYPRNE
jgi:hypothetical protein